MSASNPPDAGPRATAASGAGAASDDREDLLAWRHYFKTLDQCVHLATHRLGAMPETAAADLSRFADAWREHAIKAWDVWLPEMDKAAARVEQLLSAPRGTVVPSSNVSQVQAIVASCFDWSAPGQRNQRNRIVYSGLEFPSVSYVWQAEKRRGAEVCVVPSADRVNIDTEAMCAAIDERTAVVPLSHVVFGTSSITDVAAICDKARSVGAHVLLDCYQSVGAMPVDVVDLGVSFACGGFSTFLCGGPGAAYLYVRADLVERFEPRVTGWLANDAPFAFTMPEQSYAESVWRYMGGTPDIAAFYQSRSGARMVRQIGARRIRENSLRQTAMIIDIVDALGFDLRSPRAPERRGASVVFDFVGAAEVARELDRRRFFCDYRPGLGVCITPHFYNTDDEIMLFFEELSQALG